MADNINYDKHVDIKNVRASYAKGSDIVKATFCKNGNHIFLTNKQFERLASIREYFIFKESDKYPYFKRNYKKISILTFIYKHHFNDLIYKFKNGNKFDLRPSNVIIKNHKYYNKIKDEYDIVKFIGFHAKNNGGHAYVIKNPIWLTSNQLYIMACGNKHTIMCKKSYDKMKEYEQMIDYKQTYHINGEGYVVGSDKIYLHQIITELFCSGKGTTGLSVDHIDRDRTNNRFDNLRVVEFEIQHKNAKGMIKGTKRARKYNARKLPEGLTQDMMPKYVGYYTEDIKSKTIGKYTREFFRIEKHPKLNKTWSSRKSMGETWQQKLEQTKKKLYELNNDINTYELPQYVSKKVKKNGKVQLIYDRRIEKESSKERHTMSMTIQNYSESELPQRVEDFLEKVRKKYGNN